MNKKISILIAKPGLDGHDKGAKIISFALKDAGFKVFYSGLHKDLKTIINMAEKSNVAAIGLSIMSGAHISICESCLKELTLRKMESMKLLVGGVIPKKDVSTLIDIGVSGVFPNGTKISSIIESIKALF